jgi:hypothetical protein
VRATLTTVAAAVLVAAALLPMAPASAAPGVDVANASGDAVIDPTYATTVTVRGRGFQSIKGGHGGVYVFFGTVRDRWRPSQGGQTGRDYFYVPDSESRDNQGYQRFIAFPGSDTAGSAAGTMSADGSWSTTLVVPGAVFQSVDRSGNARTVDCRQVTCGVITVGAHGVTNARNESFSPVRVADLYADGSPDATASPSATPEPGAPSTAPDPGSPTTGRAGEVGPGRPATVGPAALEVDRASAHPGNVLAFAAAGLAAGAQVSAVLDDGAAGAGPFLVDGDGRVAGVLTIPSDTVPGTHELRLFGVEEPPTVSFAITAGDAPTVTQAGAVASESDDEVDRLAVLFVAGSAVVLVLALLRLVLSRRGARRG